jgi:hypothetical protein
MFRFQWQHLFYGPSPLNSQHLHFQFPIASLLKILLEVVAIGRKNAGKDPDRGVHTRRAVRGLGVNIMEDARHRIGLLQYNLSTPEINRCVPFFLFLLERVKEIVVRRLMKNEARTLPGILGDFILFTLIP